MHPLRQLVISAIALGLLLSVALTLALHPAGDEGHFHFLRTAPGAALAGTLTFLLIAVPVLILYIWIFRRATEADRLVGAIRRIAGGDHHAVVPSLPSDLDELSRGIDELRQIVVRQKTSFEEQQQLLREIVESLREGLIALDGRKKIVFANSRALQMLNIAGPAVGRSFIEVVRQHSFVDALDRAVNGEVSTERATLPAGIENRRLECRMFPVGAPNEIAVVALFIDVTQIERLETTRRDFLSDFSHEVRTPLAGLRSAIESFDGAPLKEEEEKQLRKIITRQVGRLEHLVNDLSELNRIESGDLVLTPEALELKQLLIELASDYAEQAAARGCSISVGGSDAVAWADSNRAQQIFSNLIENALKHSGATKVSIDVSREADEAVVRISDNGGGIPREDQQKVFRRFYRVDRSRSQSGSGLGLAITKHLVLQHGGTIRLDSTEGSGSLFEVRLPTAASQRIVSDSAERDDAALPAIERDE